MNPDVAKTKWCPFARSPSWSYDKNGERTKEVLVVNRQEDGRPDGGCRCVASDCMAWISLDRHDGYCGLAGNPYPNPDNQTSKP